MKIIIASIALFTWAGTCFSENISPSLPLHRVNLSARASVQVVQDLLTMTLTTVREGADAQAVQAQLKSALDAALIVAKKDARPKLMDVHTGRFGLAPRYGRDGKITGWQGTAELVLEGQDFVRISETAGKLTTLTVANASFGLTQTQRDGARAQAQDQAIALFRQRAAEIAKRFDFGSYALVEVSVNDDEGAPFYQPKMMAARAVGLDTAPVPVEAGLTSVSVTVSGSVQLQ
ncbi:SIMPL domain-containing protein [Rhodoferax sp.]|uniref:SIMPL domain-containing protein n=1 Tax=Rhodoferax sp. TaxID=50421 RepID=UPI0028528340|nr:SIMPL domain-containing protein [Rhodoferax sp.]